MFRTKGAEKIKTLFVFNNFFSENRDVFVTMRKNVQPDRPQITIQFHLRTMHDV